MSPVAAFQLFLSGFQKGGSIMWPILFVSLVVWYIGLKKALELYRFIRARNRVIFSTPGKSDTHFISGGTGWQAFDLFFEKMAAGAQHTTRRNVSEEYRRSLFTELFIRTSVDLESGFASMSAWISVAPLLGLLGTVSGMVRTFRIITEFGVGNPTLTAEGISIALITTQAGLTVAVPALLFHNFLMAKKERYIARLVNDRDAIVSLEYGEFNRNSNSNPSGNGGEDVL
jgi:biopolymer transport protein ExbB